MKKNDLPQRAQSSQRLRKKKIEKWKNGTME
jgi:hypothetical protein